MSELRSRRLDTIPPAPIAVAVSRCLFVPNTPMSRRQVYSLAAPGFDPSGQDTVARKHKRMGAITIDHCEFQIHPKGCARYRLPHRYPRYRQSERRKSGRHILKNLPLDDLDAAQGGQPNDTLLLEP